MKRPMSARLAGAILLACLGLLAVFHILVLAGIAPPDIIWGGQVEDSATDLWMLETIALLVTALFLVVIAARLGYIRIAGSRKPVAAGVWVIFAYMVLNTIGNLASGVSAERLVFAPLTILMALCALRLAIEKHSGQ